MSSLSQFFGGQGPHFTDPNRFNKFLSVVNSLGVNLSGTLTDFQAASGSNALDSLAAIGGAVTTSDVAANTYKTLLNVTGSGIVYGVITSKANGTTTFDLRFTVDGAQTTVTLTGVTSAKRLFLGYVTYFAASTNYGLDTGQPASITMDGTQTFYNLSGVSWAALGPVDCDNRGIGGLKFSSSMLIEMRANTAQTGTANLERSAGVFYQVGR